MNPKRAKPPPKGAVQSIPVESGEHVQEFKVKYIGSPLSARMIFIMLHH